MVDIISVLFYLYFMLYQFSILIIFVGLWVSLSYVDRVHFRERARRCGLVTTSIIEHIMIKRSIYDNFRIMIIRPVCVIFELLVGFLEGIENFEAIILISENNTPMLPQETNSDSRKITITYDLQQKQMNDLQQQQQQKQMNDAQQQMSDLQQQKQMNDIHQQQQMSDVQQQQQMSDVQQQQMSDVRQQQTNNSIVDNRMNNKNNFDINMHEKEEEQPIQLSISLDLERNGVTKNTSKNYHVITTRDDDFLKDNVELSVVEVNENENENENGNTTNDNIEDNIIAAIRCNENKSIDTNELKHILDSNNNNNNEVNLVESHVNAPNDSGQKLRNGLNNNILFKKYKNENDSKHDDDIIDSVKINSENNIIVKKRKDREEDSVNSILMNENNYDDSDDDDNFGKRKKISIKLARRRNKN
jgi:hypothetical protein